jgi:NitT/TauT family transport system permease protein
LASAETVPRRTRIARDWLLPGVVIAAIVLAWEVLGRLFHLPDFVVPLPSVIGHELVLKGPMILSNLWVTLLEALAGFLVGNVVALGLAVVSIYSPFVDRLVMPFALAVRSIPVVALTPLLILLLGVDWKPKVAVAALVVFFPTLVNMAIGLRAVDARAFELMHVLNASRWQVLRHLRFPSSVPYFFAALKVAVPSAVLGAAVAEWINAGAGLGYLIIIATFQFQTPLLYATMVVACAATMILYWTVGLLERWLVPWREER